MADLEKLKIVNDNHLKIINDALIKDYGKIKSWTTLDGDETNAELCTKINAN